MLVAEGYRQEHVFLKRALGKWFFREEIYYVYSFFKDADHPRALRSETTALTHIDFLVRQLSGCPLRPMRDVLNDFNY